MDQDRSKIKFIFRWLAKEKNIVYKIYLLALTQAFLYALIPLGIQGIVTYTMAGSFSASLWLLCFATVVISLLIGLLQLWQVRINETLQQGIFGEITQKLIGLLNVNEKSQEIRNKLIHFFETITLEKGITKVLLEFSFSLISIFLGLIILPAYSSWFLIFTLLLSLSFYLILSYYGKKAIDENYKTSGLKYNVFNTLNSNLQNTQNPLNEYLRSRNDYFNTLETQYKFILSFKLIFISVLLVLGAYLVQNGSLNIGQFVASEIIILLVINSVEKLVTSISTCYDIITALTKIEDLIGTQNKQSFIYTKSSTQEINDLPIYTLPYSRKIKNLFYLMLLLVAVGLFSPWTQSVETSGSVSALNPENKPQMITSRISGRLEKWFINDGDFVNKNDTIAYISELKDEYLDPQLLDRSQAQIRSKETALESYENKINSINKQIDALTRMLSLKREQLKNKIEQTRIKFNSDSIDQQVAFNNYKIAEEQYKRYEELWSKGVVSKTDLEARKIKLQEAQGKNITTQNKLQVSKNELINTQLELQSIQQEYTEKLMKNESDKFSTLSLLYDTEAGITKMQNQLSNYRMRQSYYYVLAPQDGYIHTININGVGEIIKEGGSLCSITPKQNEQAVELYISPMDLPLISKGQKIQIVFDGWPAFVFSGWPGISYGTYNATIVSFDRTISKSGKYRVLAKNFDKPWPKAIQIGGGVKGFALLKNVPLIYELWRKANGFPPEYYKVNDLIYDNENKSK